jgi:hypothetical protein
MFFEKVRRPFGRVVAKPYRRGACKLLPPPVANLFHAIYRVGIPVVSALFCLENPFITPLICRVMIVYGILIPRKFGSKHRVAIFFREGFVEIRLCRPAQRGFFIFAGRE